MALPPGTTREQDPEASPGGCCYRRKRAQNALRGAAWATPTRWQLPAPASALGRIGATSALSQLDSSPLRPWWGSPSPLWAMGWTSLGPPGLQQAVGRCSPQRGPLLGSALGPPAPKAYFCPFRVLLFKRATVPTQNLGSQARLAVPGVLRAHRGATTPGHWPQRPAATPVGSVARHSGPATRPDSPS